MKRILLLFVSLVLISSAAMADHIGAYSDASGAGCTLSAGFSTSATIIHKFTVGATGCRFKVTFPAGSTFFSFTTSYTPVGGDFEHDYEVGYGSCLSGSIVVGNIVAILTPGIVAVLPPDTFTHADAVNCSFAYVFASVSSARVGPGLCGDILPVESSTWGNVKSLYR